MEKRVVYVDGCRIPFQKSGTGYRDLMAYDLGRLALKGLLHRTNLDPEEIDAVIFGIVVSEVKTSNVAREIVLGAALPNKIPAHTVTQACISSNRAITDGVEMIRSGKAKVVIAGGTDTLSDFPIRFPRKFRKKLLAAQKMKSWTDYLKFFFSLRPSDFFPEIPSISEFSVGLTMGQSADRLAARIGVSRREQDEYALRAHKKAAEAYQKGLLQRTIYPVRVPPTFETIERDNLVREDTSIEKLSSLKPVFVKKYGTITAGNSSPFTDGASCVLLMEEEVAKSLGYTPKAVIKDYLYTAHEPLEELLLGPAYSAPLLLSRNGLTTRQVDVFEFHEAFAGQLLACLKCIASENFQKEQVGLSQSVGEVPLEKLNTWGGSLSLGHPFAATGARLVMTAVERLREENGSLALIASCAAGAQSHAMILERC